jgi:hypothetical protein
MLIQGRPSIRYDTHSEENLDFERVADWTPIRHLDPSFEDAATIGTASDAAEDPVGDDDQKALVQLSRFLDLVSFANCIDRRGDDELDVRFQVYVWNCGTGIDRFYSIGHRER